MQEIGFTEQNRLISYICFKLDLIQLNDEIFRNLYVFIVNFII